MQSEQYFDIQDSVISLFEIWQNNFGAKLQDRKAGALTMETVNVWSVALTQFDMTDIEFENALMLSLKLEWPPSSPADFVMLARRAVTTQFPDCYTAYVQAANSNYLHAVCEVTASRVGEYRIRTQSENAVYREWQATYKEVCEEYVLDSVKFEQIHAKISYKPQSAMKVADTPKLSLEAQSAIAIAAIEKLRSLL